LADKCPLFSRQRTHIVEMAQAFVIATTTDAETAGDPPRALWAVLADTPHLAVEAARASGCEVDRIVGTLSEETVERLGIQPGQPRRL
jgi:hypothetical protein